MRFLKLFAVSAAYIAILGFLHYVPYPDIALGASLAPICLVFWGKPIYAYLSTSKKFIDFQASAILMIPVCLPFFIAVAVGPFLAATGLFSAMDKGIASYTFTIILEWFVYVLIWSGEASVHYSGIVQRRKQEAKLLAANRESAERTAREKVQQERLREEARQKKLRDDHIASEHEHEKEFYRLREETLGLFLKYHAFLKDEVTLASITKEYEERQPSIHDSWNDFLLFNKRWQFRILVGAARNNLLNDYSEAEEAISDVFPRDQVMLLVNDAMRRDAKMYDSEACIQRLSSLHDKIVQLFNDRRSRRDAVTADAYDQAFAEPDDDPKGPNPFDEDDDRLTHQGNVG